MNAEPAPSAALPAAVPVRPATEKPRHQAQAGLFYRVNSSKSTFAELWRDTRSPVVLLAWLTKLLRVKLDGSVNDPNVVSLRPFVVRPREVADAIPLDQLQKLAPMVRELTGLGFANPVHFVIDDPFHQSRTIQVALVHSDGRSGARVTFRREGAGLKKEHLFVEFISAFADKTFLYSSTAKAQTLVPAAVRLNWDHKATLSQLWITHRRELEEAMKSTRPYKLADKRHLVEVLERHHRAVRDFQLERGVFSSLQGEDLAQVEALDKNRELASTGQMRHPDVMAQLERLQNRKSNLASGLLVLGISVGLFVGIGMKAWGHSLSFILMIVGILFAHEAGHFVAMRMLGYRNVQMFFVPLLGAAVKGENYTAPGWKKVVVSLMGPVPGILIGSALGIVALMWDNQSLVTFSLLTIALNGLQLIPILPLDGGRVMQTIIFCRHYSLDVAFQIIAAILLGLIAVAFGDYFLIAISVILLSGIGTSIKVGKIVEFLRNRGMDRYIEHQAKTAVLPANPALPVAGVVKPDADAERAGSVGAIPIPVADTIIGQIQEKMPKVKAPKLVAQLTMRVFESMATRPPGVGASIGFGLLHGGSFVVAIVMAVVLAVGQVMNSNGLLSALAGMPERSLDPTSVQVWHADASGDSAAITTSGPAASDQKYLVATFATPEEANGMFATLRSDATPPLELFVIGNTIIATYENGDDAREKFDLVDPLADDVFIASDEVGVAFTVSCYADPTANQKIVDQLELFFGLPSGMQLIPPWIEPDRDPRSPDEKRRHDANRRLLVELSELGMFSFYDDPSLEAIREKQQQAIRRNDDEEIERLAKEMTEAVAKLRKQAVDRIRNRHDDPEQETLIDLYESIQAEQEAAFANIDYDTVTDAEWEAPYEKSRRRKRDELGPLLGQLEYSHDDDVATYTHLMFSQGSATMLSGTAYIPVQWTHPARDLPRFLDWLSQEGCGDIKYQIVGPSDGYLGDL